MSEKAIETTEEQLRKLVVRMNAQSVLQEALLRQLLAAANLTTAQIDAVFADARHHCDVYADMTKSIPAAQASWEEASGLLSGIRKNIKTRAAPDVSEE